MEERKKEAIIEILANKIVLSVYEKKDNSLYNIIEEYSEKVELADEILTQNLIRPVVIKSLMKIMKSYRKICDNFGIAEIYCLMPNYFTNAKNIKSINEEIYNVCGINVTILSSEEQTKSLFCGAVNTTDLIKGIYFYVGEFETLFVQFNRRNILNSAILPFGYYTFSKLKEEATAEECEKYLADFKEAILKLNFLFKEEGEVQLLTNGEIFANVGALARKATKYPLDITLNYATNKETFENVYNLVANLDLDKTKKLKGLKDISAEKFSAALQLSNIAINILNPSIISISDENMREGYLNFYAMPEVFDRPLSDMFAYSLSLINEFYKIPNSNNEKVYDLAINVYKQLKVIHKLPRDYVKALRVASFMYDCGKRISQTDYIKNGFDIILHSRIKGVSQKDLLLAAFACKLQDLDNLNLTEWVRYSSILTEDDLEAVKKIGIIVKIAATLDCTKMSVVDDLSCDILGDSIIMKTIVNKDASYEINEAMKINPSFKKVFVKFIEII